MKKYIVYTLLSLSVGCGDIFVTNATNTTNSGGSGGSANSGSETNTITSAASGGSSTTFLDVTEKYIDSECETLTVYVPAQEYNGFPSVSCYKPKSKEKVYGFSYNIYGGTYDVYGCDKNDHHAVWFITKFNENNLITNELFLYQKYISQSDLDWFDLYIDSSSGPAAYVEVALEDPAILQQDEIFCFGHFFSFNQLAKPTCIVACKSEKDLYKFQIGSSKVDPFFFRQINNLPDIDQGPKMNFISSIFTSEY